MQRREKTTRKKLTISRAKAHNRGQYDGHVIWTTMNPRQLIKDACLSVSILIVIFFSQLIRANGSEGRLSDLEAFDISICGRTKTNKHSHIKEEFRSDDGNTNPHGGFYAKQGQFPWFVNFDIDLVDTNEKVTCAGTLIHRDLVITLASCFNDSAIGTVKSAKANIGSLWRSQSDSMRQTIAVESICFAKKFKPKSDRETSNNQKPGHDFAVVKLANEVSCSDYANSICLYLPKQKEQFRYYDCVAAGYEIYDKDIPKVPTENVTATQVTQCSLKDELKLDRRQLPDETCYKTNTEWLFNPMGPCSGTRGAGVYCRHEDSINQVLVGLLIDEPNCKSGQLQPVLFTDLYKVREALSELFTSCLNLEDDLDF